MNLQNRLLELLQAGQGGLLYVLHALGLAGDEHGQAAWPFQHRLAVETLVLDGGLTRQVALVLGALAAALLLAVAGACSKRLRWSCWGIGALLLLVVPWPDRSLVLTDAVATSFHHSPTGFAAASIERGLLLYHAQCATCHGDDGLGEGPRAASLAMWPPRLTSDLLWRRAEGEVFWRILHGMRDRHGVETMPGADRRLSDADVWSLIDAMKALAAGRSLMAEAAWSPPVRAPDAAVRCARDGAARSIRALRGQRLRIVAGTASLPVPLEDPRLLTIVLVPSAGAAAGAAADCRMEDAAAYAAYAEVSGAEPASFDGAQLLVDRDGWLRAYGRPGKDGWSKRDFVCRSAAPRDDPPGPTPATRDGLGDLIAAIDADPVRSAGLGIAHARR